ncbi:autotransporter outer membrane beta-barrel domain-containing protein [Herbaspirillum sp.]|uniref:autotransporter outer membrane beta-barrel domain-containing protein n=1 Tax=Herbaspirillum sp. TaxID=1890675 RepID=UPI0025C236D7|nr:autotransporter outer membrane beta-barrel domain-containing protein [Herbaspirillum sp.]
MTNNATLSVTETLLVGGSGGGGNSYNTGTGGSGGIGGIGGKGGTGMLTTVGSSIAIGANGALIIGGDNGKTSTSALAGPGGTGGAGTFNFGGGSTLSFGTGASFTIRSNGTFNIGNATINGTTGGTVSGLSALANDGTINFNQTDAFTLSANIAGAGSLNQNGNGTTVLTGNNTYSGATTISGGTLQVGNGGTNGTLGSGNVLNNGTLVFNRSGNVAVNNSITGTGSLVQQGSGTLTLAGGNAWSGNTTVTAGTLALGSYTQTAGQTLTIGASSNTNYGKLAVTGAASFNPGANLVVNVAGLNSLAAGQTLRGVVTAGTLTASTFNVTDNSALFNFTPVLNGNTIDLNIVSASSATGTGSSSSASVAGAVNAAGLKPAIGAARVLDTQVNGTPTGDMANVITALGRLSDLPSVARAADQTLPQNFGSAALSGTLSSLNRLFSGRFASSGQTGLSSGDAMTNRQVWLMPFGSRASQDDRDGASGFSANTWGLAAGIEADLDNLRLGLAYAYGNTNVIGNADLSGAGSHAKIDSNVLALYGSVPVSDLTLGFQVDTGWNSSRSNRDLNFGGLNRTASADYGTWSAHAGASLSKAVPLTESTTLIPALRLDYTRLQSQSYTETGAGALNLNVAAKTTEALVLGVESRLVHALDAQSQLSAHLGAGYDAINDRGDLVAAYAGAPGQSFTASGIDHSPWIIKAGIGYTHKTAQGTDVSLRYDAEGRSGFINQSASVKATWRF